MNSRGLTKKEAEALRAARAVECPEASPEEAARAVRLLSPSIESAARRLESMRAERRALRLQAWGLAGCMAAFAALLWLGYQYREFLLEMPGRWGFIAGFCAVSMLVTGCLPLILKKEGEKKNA